MRRYSLAAPLCAALALGPAPARAAPAYHQCQRPVTTGVEVFDLHRIVAARACPVALALYSWENASGSHVRALYSCRQSSGPLAVVPVLLLRSFRGWRLSLRGHPYGVFTMTRGASSFAVGGTDFPIACN